MWLRDIILAHQMKLSDAVERGDNDAKFSCLMFALQLPSMCAQEGLTKIYEYSEMQGDHIVAWRNGGKTVESNLQMLCAACNNAKSGK